MAVFRKNPNQVFTPRGEAVTEMYVSRPDLENALMNSLNQPKNIVIHGESGSGKSWLYKSVFKKNMVRFDPVNLGKAVAYGSISKLFTGEISRFSEDALIERSVTSSAEANVVLANGGVATERVYVPREKDSLEQLFAAIRKGVPQSRKCVLVLDNLEQILDFPDLVRELASILILVDDHQYARHDVKILLVGTANIIHTFHSSVPNSITIRNRLVELPEVARLVPASAERFVRKGLFEALDCKVVTRSNFNEKILVDSVLWYTDRIPQYLHELCLDVANLAIASGRDISIDTFQKAAINWVRSALVAELAVVDANLNINRNKVGRRNQVVYALGRCGEEEIDANRIERIVRKEFPESCNGVGLNISQTLSQLSESDHPLLRKLPFGNGYRFVDPRLRIVIRWKLQREFGSEKLRLRDFGDAIEL